jgi:UDP-2-acetamido-2-deoxy-ribo-hexuluronate aminotransferase
MIALLGIKPVFVDIDPLTYNIDPAKIESAINEKTKAIMPVSLYGQCADFDAINAIAARHNLPVIEDAAQSFGATCQGRQSCNLSTIGCTSFFPSKPLGGYGDGGACFTNDDDLAQAIRELKNHGQSKRYYHSRIGINGRLDTIQAAVLLAKMDLFPAEVEARAQIGARYSDKIQALCPDLKTPVIAEGYTSVYAQYTVQADDRDGLQEHLNQEGIPTAVHYPVPLNEQPALYTKEYALPVSDKLASRVISLPMHPYLQEKDQDKIVAALSRFSK